MIVFLPIDERFCTKDYFVLLGKSVGIPIQVPEKLGMKKIPADADMINSWLSQFSNTTMVISIEMLVHGGLVPSRIDLLSHETIEKRLKILYKIKENKNQIYSTVTVTRIPKYNSADEEPEYWEYLGVDLYNFSQLVAKNNGKVDDNLLKIVGEKIPRWVIEDFLWRRQRNFNTVRKCIELTSKGVIDYLSITLDDNGEDSLSRWEGDQHLEYVKRLGIEEKVSIRNGADEASLSTLGKCITDQFDLKPKFYVKYRFPESKHLIPPYESSPLFINVENHIKAVGGVMVNNMDDCEIFLFINNFKGSEEHFESQFQKSDGGLSCDFPSEEIRYAIRNKKILGIADVRYSNGSEIDLVEKILSLDLDWTRCNYYGWNTAGNTIGSVCAHSVLQLAGNTGYLKIDREEMERYQATLFLEHYGYQAIVRQKLREAGKGKCNILRTTIPCENWAIQFTKEHLSGFLKRINQLFHKNWSMEIFFPWHRSFEIGIILKTE